MKTRITAEKVNTYKEKLYSLLYNIEEQKEAFVASKWVKENKAGAYFILACKNLGYITVHYTNRKFPTYYTKLSSKIVEPIHGKNVYVEVSDLVHASNMKRKASVENSDKVEGSDTNLLEEFSDTLLVDELHRRGYVGKLTKTLEI